VVSNYTSESRGFAKNERDAAQLCLSAGLDMSMQSALLAMHMPELVRAGRLPEMRPTRRCDTSSASRRRSVYSAIRIGHHRVRRARLGRAVDGGRGTAIDDANSLGSRVSAVSGWVSNRCDLSICAHQIERDFGASRAIFWQRVARKGAGGQLLAAHRLVT